MIPETAFVLIVSRTLMSGNRRCFGGLLRTPFSYRSVRLMDARTDENGDYWTEETPFQIGEIWEITFSESTERIAPHVENIRVLNFKREKRAFSNLHKMGEWLRLRVERFLPECLWTGNPQQLFEGKLQSTRPYMGSGYLTKGQESGMSTGFWVPDKELIRVLDEEERFNYVYDGHHPHSGIGKLKYIGEPPPVHRIPPGTLVRVSLSRWRSIGEFPEACWLMLSGWYAGEAPES